MQDHAARVNLLLRLSVRIVYPLLYLPHHRRVAVVVSQLHVEGAAAILCPSLVVARDLGVVRRSCVNESMHPLRDRNVVVDVVRNAIDRSDRIIELFERMSVEPPSAHRAGAVRRVRSTARRYVQLGFDRALGDHLRCLFRNNDEPDRCSNELPHKLLLGVRRTSQRCTHQPVADLLPQRLPLSWDARRTLQNRQDAGLCFKGVSQGRANPVIALFSAVRRASSRVEGVIDVEKVESNLAGLVELTRCC